MNGLTPAALAGLGAALLGNLLYHLASRGSAASSAPFAMLATVYVLAAILCAGLAVVLEGRALAMLPKALANPWLPVLVVAIILIEAGFLYAYRHGAPVSLASLSVNASAIALLALIGIAVLREPYDWRTVAGSLLALAGVTLALSPR